MATAMKFTKAELLGLVEKFGGPGAARPLDRTFFKSSDLIFSSKEDKEWLEPLSGYRVITVADVPIRFFPEGFKANFRIFHNETGNARILLYDARLVVARHWAETDVKLFYEREGRRIIGVGPTVHDYEVEFQGTVVKLAERNLGKGKFLRARNENFFTTEPSDPIELTAGGSPAQITVFGRATLAGIYELLFRFAYDVSGKQRSHESEIFYVVKR